MPEKNLPEIYRRLLQYTKSHWHFLAIAVIGMLVYSVGNTGMAAFMKPLLDEDFFLKTTQSSTGWLSLGIIGIFIVRGVGNYLSVYYMGYIGQVVVRNLRTDMFEHLLHLPATYFDQYPKGTILSKLTYNVEQTAVAASKALVVIVRDTFTAIGLISWLLYLNWILTLFLTILVIPIAFIVRFASRRFRKISRKVQNAYGVATSDIQQVIENNAMIKVSGAQKYECESFASNNEEIRRQKMRILRTQASNAPLIMLIAGLATVGIIHASQIELIGQSMTTGTLVSMLVTIMLLFRPLRNLVNLNSVLQAGIIAAASVFEMLDEPIEQITAAPIVKRIKGDICFKNVAFRYANTNYDALSNINLNIHAGETVAIVGQSGSGKSTLISLIPRLYEPTSGVIEIDQQDTNQWDLQQLRAQIAYAGQFSISIRGTIADNIAYGIEASSEQIRAAAEKACALEFIEKLPQKFATPITNNLLSNGQIQRIILARTLLKDLPILIFDEITSALDKVTESNIRQALRESIIGRTVIIITHRFVMIELAQRILVIDNGQIIEQGSHEELMAKHGKYRELYLEDEGKN